MLVMVMKLLLLAHVCGAAPVNINTDGDEVDTGDTEDVSEDEAGGYEAGQSSVRDSKSFYVQVGDLANSPINMKFGDFIVGGNTLDVQGQDGGWSDYGPCNKICGGGVKERSCTNPAPTGAGKFCSGIVTARCNTQPCAGVSNQEAIKILKTTIHDIEVALRNLEKNSRSKREFSLKHISHKHIFSENERKLLEDISEATKYVQNACTSRQSQCQFKTLEAFVEMLTTTFNKIKSTGETSPGFVERLRESKEKFDSVATVSEQAQTGEGCEDIVCPATWSPVCGADGKTYSNTCSACGVDIACGGECPCSEGQVTRRKEGESCGFCHCPPSFSAGDCEQGLICQKDEMKPFLPGVCKRPANGGTGSSENQEEPEPEPGPEELSSENQGLWSSPNKGGFSVWSSASQEDFNTASNQEDEKVENQKGIDIVHHGEGNPAVEGLSSANTEVSQQGGIYHSHPHHHTAHDGGSHHHTHTPQDGGWSAYGPCTAYCGGGTKTRTCSNPAPAGGGKDCTGSTTLPCNEQPCSISSGLPSTCSASSPRYIPHATDCQKYYECATGHAPREYTCAGTTRWDTRLHICNQAENVPCPRVGAHSGDGGSDFPVDRDNLVPTLIEEKKELYVCFSAEGCPLIRNTLITTLIELKKEFYISFEFRATQYIDGHQNVLHLTTGGNTDRKFILWVKNDGHLYASFTAKTVLTKEKYATGQWHRVEFEQQLKSTQYIYKLRINGVQIVEVVNSEPNIISNLKVYAPDPWHNALKGSLRNLVFICETTRGEKSFKSDEEITDHYGMEMMEMMRARKALHTRRGEEDGHRVTVTAKFWFVSDYEGGEEAAKTTAARHVAATNEALKNSEVPIDYLLWGTVEELPGTNDHINKDQTIDCRFGGTDSTNRRFLNALGDDAESRNRLKQSADHVVLMFNDLGGRILGRTCGFGPWESGITQTYTTIIIMGDEVIFAHEAGHGMGALHNREEHGGGDPASFNYGYCLPDKPYATVMSYPHTCPHPPRERILYYSNPEVLYDGVPTGTEKDNNARAMTEARDDTAADGNNCMDGKGNTDNLCVFAPVPEEFSDWSECCCSPRTECGWTTDDSGSWVNLLNKQTRTKTRECTNLLGEPVYYKNCLAERGGAAQDLPGDYQNQEIADCQCSAQTEVSTRAPVEEFYVALSSHYTKRPYPAENCVDGNEDTFCHTDIEENPYFVIEYPKPTKINEVTVIARKICCWDRVKKIAVIVTNEKPTKGKSALDSGSQLGSTFDGPATKAGQVITFKSENGVTGKYVIVQQQYKGVLNLAEVQVKVNKGLMLHATCDNEMKIFADTNLLVTDDHWPRISEVEIPEYTNIIEIHCHNSGGIGGILASCDNGHKTDGSWSCSGDGGSTWNPAYEIGSHGMSPWGVRPQISIEAKWIWTAKDTFYGKHKNVICKISLGKKK